MTASENFPSGRDVEGSEPETDEVRDLDDRLNVTEHKIYAA